MRIHTNEYSRRLLYNIMLCCGVLCWVGAGDGSWLDYEVELSARSEASGGTVFIGAAAAPKQTRTLTSHTHQPHAHAHRHTQLDSSLRECVCKVRGVAVCPCGIEQQQQVRTRVCLRMDHSAQTASGRTTSTRASNHRCEKRAFQHS